MAELMLSQDQRLSLRAQAHGLDPLVLLGAAGLSDAVYKEIDRALKAHGLIKVRAGKMEAEERAALFLAMAERLEAARIQSIGHTFVLFRPVPPPTPKPPAARRAPGTRKAAPLKQAAKRTTKRPAAAGGFTRGAESARRSAAAAPRTGGARPRSGGGPRQR